MTVHHEDDEMIGTPEGSFPTLGHPPHESPQRIAMWFKEVEECVLTISVCLHFHWSMF